MRLFTFLFIFCLWLNSISQTRAEEKSEPVKPSTEISEENDDSFTRTYRKALVAFKEDDLATAQAAAEEAQKLKPDDSKPVLLLGRIATAKKDYATAEKLIQSVITQNPRNSISFRYLGELYFAQHDFYKAEHTFSDWLKADPKNPDALLWCAYAEVGRDDLAAAGAYTVQMDPFHPSHPGFYYAKAAIARKAGKPADAEKNLQAARTIYGNATAAEFMKDYLLLFAPKP